jgi:alpha-L-fucosidase
VDYLVLDGWFWRMGHHEVPFTEIREHIRDLQPECLLTDHTHLQAIYHVDIPYFEGPFGAFPPEGNTMPSSLGHCSVKGNGWFWSPETPTGLKQGESAESIVAKLDTLENRYCNFMLNCMPNRDGLLDPLYMDLLAEIGRQWKPDTGRPTLPVQEKSPVYAVPAENATATSGNAADLIDAKQVGSTHFHWSSDSSMPQQIVLDLGAVYDGIDALMIVPNHRCKPTPESALKEGNITKLQVSMSADNIAYELVAAKTYPADAKPRNIRFDATTTRYVKIDILEAYGSSAVVAEIAVGGSDAIPTRATTTVEK